jgi:glycosyltransferase involved in cell wall biosynthesis
MRFVFLVAAYNEARILPSLIEKFMTLQSRNVDFEVCILDNASTDGTQNLATEKMKEVPWLRYLRIEQKGLGAAFTAGLKHYKDISSKDCWFVFTAADLPFGFTDFDSFLEYKNKYPNCGLFVGSKQHPHSQVKRDFKRKFMSAVFFVIRRLVLGLATKDTQGTIFLKSEYAGTYEQIKSVDYFFTTELIYLVAKKTSIVEMPVTYLPELRPSNVRVIADGMKFIKQLVRLRFR